MPLYLSRFEESSNISKFHKEKQTKRNLIQSEFCEHLSRARSLRVVSYSFHYIFVRLITHFTNIFLLNILLKNNLCTL